MQVKSDGVYSGGVCLGTRGVEIMSPFNTLNESTCTLSVSALYMFMQKKKGLKAAKTEQPCDEMGMYKYTTNRSKGISVSWDPRHSPLSE